MKNVQFIEQDFCDKCNEYIEQIPHQCFFIMLNIIRIYGIKFKNMEITEIKFKNMEITEKELDSIAHSLGINIYHSKKSKYKKDKKLPKEFYRNYYCTSGLDDFKNLIDLNVMVVFKTDHYHYLEVTEYGIELFRKEFNHYVNEKN